MNRQHSIFSTPTRIATRLLAFILVISALATLASAQVAPDALPPETPKIDTPVSPFGFYALTTLFAALVMVGTFKNARRNEVVELRKLSGAGV